MKFYYQMNLLSFSFSLTAMVLLMSTVSAYHITLATSSEFALLSKAGVTTTGLTSITGDMGVSPIASTAMTGFGLILDSTTTFSTSTLVTGKIYAASYTSPTPSKMTTAISDMEAAFNEAAGRLNPDFIELGAGSIEGLTLTQGLYKWGTSVGFTSGVTFSGSSTDVWVLQIAGSLNAGSGAIVTLTGGALAENIFWQVSGGVIVGTTAQMQGILLSKTGIVFKTGSSLVGRALAQTAITLDATTISVPTDSAVSVLRVATSGGDNNLRCRRCCRQKVWRWV
jgi:hypothetical protein